METETYTMRPGDYCLLVADPTDPDVTLVEHRRCDEHPDGTITDPRTGVVVSSR